MTLRERRCYFTALLAKVVEYVNAIPGFQIALDEGMVSSPRAVKLSTADKEKTIAYDAVHIPASFHHNGLACDLLLYRNGDYIADGGDPIWAQIDKFCRSLDPWFGLGISFHDANHLSYGEHREDPH